MAKCIPRHVKPNARLLLFPCMQMPLFTKGLVHNAPLLCAKQRYLHTGIECEIITHAQSSQSVISSAAIYAHVAGYMCTFGVHTRVREKAAGAEILTSLMLTPRATVGIISPTCSLQKEALIYAPQCGSAVACPTQRDYYCGTLRLINVILV